MVFGIYHSMGRHRHRMKGEKSKMSRADTLKKRMIRNQLEASVKKYGSKLQSHTWKMKGFP